MVNEGSIDRWIGVFSSSPKSRTHAHNWSKWDTASSSPSSLLKLSILPQLLLDLRLPSWKTRRPPPPSWILSGRFAPPTPHPLRLTPHRLLPPIPSPWLRQVTIIYRGLNLKNNLIHKLICILIHKLMVGDVGFD